MMKSRQSDREMSKENVFTVIPTREQLTSINKNVKCTQEGCDKTFIHNGSLKLHLVKSHRQVFSDAEKRLYHRGKIRNKLGQEPQFLYQCPEEDCRYSNGQDRHFNTFSHLKQHYMKTHAEKVYECSKCERNFSRECDLGRHEPNCGQMYQCGQCPVKYTTTEALLTHCKRQTHHYPAEYRKKDKEKEAKKQKSSGRNISTIAMVPVVVMVSPPELPKPPPTVPIKPKQSKGRSVQKIRCHNGTGDHITISPLEDSSAPRHDAHIQTDIFGVNSLSVSGRQNLYQQTDSFVNHNHTNHRSQKRSVSGNFLSPPKKTPSAKRKLGLDRYTNPSSPRRKKTKSSTGMQTSVSWTKKPTPHSVSGTQTTGDYILKAAMAKADIQIERKTVGSQVTPQKRISPPVQHSEKCTIETQTFAPVSNIDIRGDCPNKPILVDSYSQVKQRNICAETSHNLAESQTMTDLPPSISTQTLQSYLVNQQERKLSKKQINRDMVTGLARSTAVKSTTTSSNIIAVGCSVTVKAETVNNGADRDNVVEIYDSSLTSSVSFVGPKKMRRKKSTRPPYTKMGGLEFKERENQRNRAAKATVQINRSSEMKPSNSTSTETQHDIGLLYPGGINPGFHSQQSHFSTHGTRSSSTAAFNVDTSVDINSAHVDRAGSSVTDTEAQAMMSAEEFDSLLQSSGIFMNSFDSSPGTSHQALQNKHRSSHSPISVDKSIGQDFDFLHSGVNTTDTNTQTGEMSFFEDYGSIDTNTQTGGDIDFLDLVMNNMETQTINDEDLADLGLSNFNSSTATQTLGVGTSDFDWTGQQHSATFPQPVKPVLLLDQSELVQNPANQSSYSLLYNLENKVTSQSETQTIAIDATEPLLQTETQTQVELTDLETINMETQTTLEDLQQLCDWFE